MPHAFARYTIALAVAAQIAGTALAQSKTEMADKVIENVQKEVKAKKLPLPTAWEEKEGDGGRIFRLRR